MYNRLATWGRMPPAPLPAARAVTPTDGISPCRRTHGAGGPTSPARLHEDTQTAANTKALAS